MPPAPPEFSSSPRQPHWLLVTLDEQHLAIGADAVEAVFASCLPEQPERYSSFLGAQLYQGRPVFMRPLTELFKLADPHFFAPSQPRPWCVLARQSGPVGLACWVDAVIGPVSAVARLGQIEYQQQPYKTVLSAQ
jgi:hypothetical protein